MISRKRLIALVVFVFIGLIAFTFANPGDVKDTVKPVITVNPEEVKIVFGTSFDVMEGVSATDDVDTVTVTSDITDTSNLSVGEHTITYSASDTSLNVGTATRTLIVLGRGIDSDNDGYTNGEELDANTDFLDPLDIPNYSNAPTITISEDNIYSMEVNSTIPTFVATANDVYDGIINVVVTSDINTALLGTYTVTFRATDSLGNATTLTREFTVVDTTAPVINLNGKATYKFVLGQPIYIDELALVTDNYDLQSSINGVLVGDPSVIGTYNFEYDFTDSSLNVADKVVRTIVILDPLKDEDNDGYTNGEEVIANTNFDDAASTPDYDKNPIIIINPYITTPTNEDITVYASTNEGVLNFSSHVFTENGVFEFVAVDVLGNTTRKIVTITNIDKVAPTATISYDKTSLTNTNVIATLNPSENVTVTNNGGLSTYTFTNNGTFTFNFIDNAGNIGSAVATVTNIDKELPELTIKDNSIGIAPYFNTVHFKLHDANLKEAVLNGVVIDKSSNAYADMNDVTIGSYYTVVEGLNTLIVRDKAGNEVTYQFYLDVTFPVITISPYITLPTNNNITVYASTNEGNLNFDSYTFTANGSFEFIAVDAAGNTTKEVVTITNIDKVKPNINLYTGTSTTVVHNPIVNIEVFGSLDETIHRYKAHDEFDGGMFDKVIKTYYKLNASTNLYELVTAIDFNTLGSYKITYNVTDRAGNAADQKTRYVNIVDATNPVLSLIGSDLTIELGSIYTEPGFIATDNYDVNIQNKVIVSGTVNTSVIGVYTLTYSLTDSSGNSAIPVTRTVTVVKATPNGITFTTGWNPTFEVNTSATVFPDNGNIGFAFDIFDNANIPAVFVNCAINSTNTPVTQQYAISHVGVYWCGYKATDATGHTAWNSRTVNVVDTTKPVITLNGSDMELVIGQTFTDPGVAMVSDNYATLSTADVTVSGTVNANLEGTYYITYTLSDGFNTTSVIRTVVVKPLITELSVSDPSGSTSYNGFVIEFNRDFVVKNGDQITVSYEYSVDGGAYVNAMFSKNLSTYPAMLQIGSTKILTKKFLIWDMFNPGTILNGSDVSMQENSANIRLPEIYYQVQAGKQVQVRTIITFKLENGTVVKYKLTPVQYN